MERDADTGNHSAVIQLERVHKVYPMINFEVHALRGVTLSIKRSEFVAIMGPSGSGKSTMMNIIGCLDHPTRGHYFLEGVDVSAVSKPELADIRNTKIGFVFQNLNLIPRTSAIENVELPLVYAGVSSSECIRRSREALATVGLANREQSMPNQLSGGQQQRVAIARALVNDPTIILADEPTANLDLNTGAEIIALLKHLSVEQGVTIITATHDHKMLSNSDRVLWISDGSVDRLQSREEGQISVGGVAVHD